MFFVVIFTIILILFLMLHIRVVAQKEEYIIERFGKFYKVWESGVHFLLPFAERIAYRINIRKMTEDFPTYTMITKDNTTVLVDISIMYQISEAEKFAYSVENPMLTIENILATELNNLINELTLEEAVNSREVISSRLHSLIKDETDLWGIKIYKFELKNIFPPREIRDSLRKQMKINAEYDELIMRAKAKKEEKILQAEAEQRAEILRAEGERQAELLRAEAKKLAAQMEAESILEIQNAIAEGIQRINSANPSEAYLTIKALESFEKIADGKATKIIIPSQIQGIAGLASSLKELTTSLE